MKIYIKTDIEGVSGVYSNKFVYQDLGRADMIAEARKMLAHDLNACIEGCFRAGADEVIAVDGHGGGNNLLRSQVDDRAWFISGECGATLPDFEGSTAMIMLGYHAMAGTRGAVMEHSMNSRKIQNIWLNDRKIGEIGIMSVIAAERGVPTILVTGDDKACAEAADWIPGVTTCEIKKSYSCNGALMPPLSVTRERIIDSCLSAIAKLPEVMPLPQYPVRYRVELVERGTVPENPHVKIIDGRTYEITADSLETAVRFLR